MSRVVKLVGFAVLFAAGALLAVAIGRAADVTTTLTETTTTVETTTAPATTATTTVEQTTTRRLTVQPATTSTSDNDESVPTWAWILIGALAVGLIILLALLLTRRGGGSGLSPAERRGRLDAAVTSWLAQGWAVESQSADSAVLRRGNEWMLVGVDPSGYVSTRPVVPE